MKFLELSIVSVVSNWPWNNKPDYNNVIEWHSKDNMYQVYQYQKEDEQKI